MSKKGAKAQPKDQSYEIRDVVLAKVRGFPPWPGIIADPDNVPKNVSKERPNGKNKRGNWFCVRFFPAGDYAWVVPKDISKLQRHEIEAYIQEPYKKSGDLLQGYKIALDPKKWEEEKQAEQSKAAEEAENAEVDELEESVEDEAAEGEDDEEEKKPKTKKRKRDSEVASAKPKPKSKAKKEPAEPKKKAAGGGKGKKNGVKSKALVESEDEGAEGEGEDAGPSSDKKSSPPPAKKQKRDKEEEDLETALANDPEAVKVRDWRHKLQKAFLSKAVPKEDDMPGYDQLFQTVETYDGMSIQYLTFSKIGKVMRHIYALSPEKVPRDEEFKFRERAKSLVDKWHEILSASKASEGAVRKPATNGKPHVEDAGASVNGKDEANGKEEPEKKDDTAESDKEKMDVDTKDESPAATAEQDAPAEDAPADPVAPEEAAADVAMAEAA